MRILNLSTFSLPLLYKKVKFIMTINQKISSINANFIALKYENESPSHFFGYFMHQKHNELLNTFKEVFPKSMTSDLLIQFEKQIEQLNNTTKELSYKEFESNNHIIENLKILKSNFSECCPKCSAKYYSCPSKQSSEYFPECSSNYS